MKVSCSTIKGKLLKPSWLNPASKVYIPYECIAAQCKACATIHLVLLFCRNTVKKLTVLNTTAVNNMHIKWIDMSNAVFTIRG